MSTRWIKQLELLLIVIFLIASESINITPVIQGVLSIVSYTTIILLMLRQSFDRLLYVATRDWSLMLLTLFTFASFFWSVDIDDTADQLKALLRSTLFGIYLATCYSPKELMRLLVLAIGTAAVLSLGASLLFPAYGTDVTNHVFVWRGIYGHKQYFARAMAIGSMVILLTALMNKRYRWLLSLMLCLTVILMWMSTSRTAIVIFLLSVLIIPSVKIVMQKAKLREVIIIIGVLSAGYASILILSNIETILVDILGKDTNFNGRVPLWARAIEVGLSHPLFGHGYAAFWTSPASYEVSKYLWITKDLGSSHSHNGFIDTFLQLGLVGLILFMFNLVINFFKVIQHLFLVKTIEALWMLEMLSMMMIYNLFELNTILTNNFLWIYYIAISLSTAIALERVKHSRNLDKDLSLVRMEQM